MSENLPSSKNSELLGLSGADVESLSLKSSKDKLDNHLLRVTWIKLVLLWVMRTGYDFLRLILALFFFP